MPSNPDLSTGSIIVRDYATNTEIINVISYKAIRNVMKYSDITQNTTVVPPTTQSTQYYIRIYFMDGCHEDIPLGYGTLPAWSNDANGQQAALTDISGMLLP